MSAYERAQRVGRRRRVRGPMLAHKAEEEGVAVAERIAAKTVT